METIAQQVPYHREADRFEPRLARSIRKAGHTLRGRVDIDRLAAAFSGGEVAVLAVLERMLDPADAFEPSAKILADAVARGAKLAAPDPMTANPYRVVRRKGRWVVIKVSSGSVVPGGDHGRNKEAALAHWRALEAATAGERR